MWYVVPHAVPGGSEAEIYMGHRSIARSRLTLSQQLSLCLAHPLQVTADDLALHPRPAWNTNARHISGRMVQGGEDPKQGASRGGGEGGELPLWLSQDSAFHMLPHRLSPSSNVCSVLLTWRYAECSTCR